MKNKQPFSIKQLVSTAMMFALLIVAQLVTKSMGQYVTGSLVNLILASTVLLLGLIPATLVALCSPFFAFLLGIGTPIIQIVPGIALGNFVYILLIHWLNKCAKINSYLRIIIAAVVKFVVLYIVVTKLILPTLGLPEQKVSILSLSFSYPQLITALIGGIIATRIAPQIQNIMHK